jgi:hypothetical protein
MMSWWSAIRLSFRGLGRCATLGGVIGVTELAEELGGDPGDVRVLLSQLD